MRHLPRGVLAGALALVVASAAPALAQAPGEVPNLDVDGTTVSWGSVSGADDYNVYRGLVSSLGTAPAGCHGDEITATSFDSPDAPAPGEGFFYLATAESAGGEGTPGTDSSSVERDLLGRCDDVVRAHVLDRLGYGGNEWSRDRIASLGLQGYIDEQLDPALVDESTNTELNDRLAAIDPPDDHVELIAQDVVRGTYARRQLEQQATTFFNNHLSTDFIPVYQYFLGQFPNCTGFPYCDPDYPARALRHAAKEMKEAMDGFRDIAFNGTFREMVELSAKSPPMIHYLDTDDNVAAAPNENYGRELVELHTMGVDRGYTQQDVEELARVFTGWNTCKKLAADVDDPLAPCMTQYWQEPAGSDYVANFRINQHDCGEKTLFQGTAYETVIPDTCDGTGNPTADGVNDLDLALDAILDHPSTPEFIATKLLQRFVTDAPDQAMIDAVVAEWNDASNPLGVGDLREVLRAVTDLAAFRDPDSIGNKIKTPVEHVVSAFRGTRGRTDGLTVVISYLVRMQHLPYLNAVPTGWPELGGDWLGTNNMLERQNFGLHFTTNTDPDTEADFGADVIGLLQDNGVSTAPGNAEAIVDFYADLLFAGALTPAERQAAVDYLNTDDDGVPGDYDDARIRETVGFMLGYAQFEEQ